MRPNSSTAVLLPAAHNPKQRSPFSWVRILTPAKRFAALKVPKSSTAWRGGVYVGCWATSFVLICNLCLLLLGLFRYGGSSGGIGTIFKGTKKETDAWNTACHLFINILSTILLASSNYCMQILCAPTREEIDAAHDKGTWLDIGILSIRNFFHIERKRALIGFLLAFSSIPLHLFYNSAVFKVTIGRDYEIQIVSVSDSSTISWLNRIRAHNLTNEQWKSQYATQYVSGTETLYLIADKVGATLNISEAKPACLNTNEPPPSITEFGAILLYQTTGYSETLVAYPLTSNFSNCDGSTFQLPPNLGVDVSKTSGLQSLTKYDQLPWVTFDGFPPFYITHGFATPTSSGSKVQISVHFIIVVIVCNTIKLCAMLWTIRRSLFFQIVTIGDAICSFLKWPDTRTKGMCTLHRKAVIRGETPSKTYEPYCGPYIDISGERHVILRPVMAFLGVAVFGTFLIEVLINDPPFSWGAASSRRVGFAPQSFDSTGILLNAFISNSPQILLSLCYFSLNRLSTSMCFEREWNTYASKRKGLRVTRPQGHQRSTYFLQLPYKWAVPLTIASGSLHWLLSQTLFLSRLEIQDGSGNLVPWESKCTTEYSPLSGIVFGTVFLLVSLAIFLLPVLKVRYPMPYAGHCSLVISAACHPPSGDGEHHEEKVMWGVIGSMSNGELGHCSFTSRDVTSPHKGEEYA